MFPGSPGSIRTSIAERACVRNSGRIGRSAAAKGFEEDAIYLAVQAYVRHEFTVYDKLLAQGMERADARREVRNDVNRVLDSWKNRKTESGPEAVP